MGSIPISSSNRRNSALADPGAARPSGAAVRIHHGAVTADPTRSRPN